MSRSHHKTLKSVFGGKSKREIQDMIDGQHPDYLELLEKRQIKREERRARQVLKLLAAEPLPDEAETTSTERSAEDRGDA